MKLDVRLQAVANFVLAGLPAADIGTDHNYLPIYLAQNNICPKIIASDIAAAPYRKARQLAEDLCLTDKIDVRFGKGLEVLNPGEMATIIIAGMGGRLICDILAASPKQAYSAQRLVLQPQKDAPALRKWLSSHGWQIIDEKMVADKQFYYLIIAAEQGEMQLDDDQLCFGPCLLKGSAPLFWQFLENRQQEISALIKKVELSKKPDAALRLQQLSAEKQKIAAIIASHRQS